MSTVTLSIGPKSYTVACADGQEAHIRALGAVIAEKYAQLGASRAPLEAQNLLFAALFVADDLDQARKQIAALAEADTREQDALRETVSRLESELAEARDAAAAAQKETAEARDAAAVAAARAAAPPPLAVPAPQFDLFGGRPADERASEALADRLEALAARAEASAAALEAATASA